MKIMSGKVVYAFEEKPKEIPSITLKDVFIEGDECPQSTLLICNDIPEQFSSLKGEQLRREIKVYAEQNQKEILRHSISANHIAAVHPSR